MIDDILEEAATRMGKSVGAIKNEFIRIRTGRANTSLLDHLMVDYYGSPTQISQCATVGVADARTLSIQPWEKNMVAVIERAIMESDLGLNPVTAGEHIRIPLPPMTEERRIEMTKIVKNVGENGKIAIRNIRRDAMSQVKELEKEKEISEDQEKSTETQIQALTDKYVAEMDAAVAEKQKEVMEV